MKLLFSEIAPDYARYLYPYVIWGVPGPGETPADLYDAGFHPASPALDRFVLCRQLRVPLPEFVPSSENRRILRKGSAISVTLIPRSDYEYSETRRTRWLAFAEERFGVGVMPAERLDGLMNGRVITHVFTFREGGDDGPEVGTVLMYLEPPRMAHYYYAFYDRQHSNRSLGLHLMTRAIVWFQQAGFEHLYLGTCYSQRALYKTQFNGLAFFHGIGWSTDLETLKFLVRRDAPSRHLLQEPEFLTAHGGIAGLASGTAFDLALRRGAPTAAAAAAIGDSVDPT